MATSVKDFLINYKVKESSAICHCQTKSGLEIELNWSLGIYMISGNIISLLRQLLALYTVYPNIVLQEETTFTILFDHNMSYFRSHDWLPLHRFSRLQRKILGYPQSQTPSNARTLIMIVFGDRQNWNWKVLYSFSNIYVTHCKVQWCMGERFHSVKTQRQWEKDETSKVSRNV